MVCFGWKETIGKYCRFLTLVALIVSIGCSGSTESNGERIVKTVAVEKVVEKIVEKEPDADRKLVVYSGRSESLVAPIIRQFSEVSGIDVYVKYAKTGSLAATLLEEGSRSPADVFFAQDPGGLGSIQDMLSVLDSEILNLVPGWASSPSGQWVGISGRARTIVYNNDRLKGSDLPETLESFTSPEWKGRIGWPPSNTSFQAMVTAMRIMWGEEKAKKWLEDIQANDPVVYLKNTPIIQAVSDGEVDVGFVNHYYLHRFIAEYGESFSARNYYLPGGGPGSVILVAGVGILETTKNQTEAESFVKFLLGLVAQQYFSGQTFEYPLIEGIKTPRGVPELESLNKPNIDLSDLGDLEVTQGLLRLTGVIP